MVRNHSTVQVFTNAYLTGATGALRSGGAAVSVLSNSLSTQLKPSIALRAVHRQSINKWCHAGSS